MKKNIFLSRIFNLKELIIGLIIIILASSLIPNFFSLGNLVSIVAQIAVLSMFAFAVTFPGLLKEYDLSVGASAGFCATFFTVINLRGIDFGTSLILALALAFVCGMLNGFLVVEIGISAIVATIGTAFMFNAFELILNKGVRVIASDTVRDFGFIKLGPIPINIIITLVVLIILYFFSMRTSIGRLIYAIGENKIAAQFSGVRVKLYSYLCFIGAAIIGTLGGILAVATTATAQIGQGDKFLWNAFMAFFIGVALFKGKKHFLGTFIGVIFSVVIGQILLLAGVPHFHVYSLTATILLLAIILSSYQRSALEVVKVSKKK